MKKFLILSVVALAAVSVAVTAAFAKPAQRTATAHVCVLLPDTKSSVRWEQFDRPFMEKTLNGSEGQPTRSSTRSATRRSRTRRPTSASRTAPRSSSSSRSTPARPSRSRRRPRLQVRKSIDYDRQVEGGNAVALHLVRRQDGRRAPGPAAVDRRSEGEGHVQQEARRRRSSGGGQVDNNSTSSRAAMTSILKPLFKNGTLHQGPGAVRAGLGRPDGADDLRADARQDEQQDRRRRGGERQPRQRGRRRAQGSQAQADPAERPGRDRRRACRTSSPVGRR